MGGESSSLRSSSSTDKYLNSKRTKKYELSLVNIEEDSCVKCNQVNYPELFFFLIFRHKKIDRSNAKKKKKTTSTLNISSIYQSQSQQY